MTKISDKSTYVIDKSLSGQEFLVGTDDNGQTKSYTLQDIAALVLSVDPDTIDLTPVTVSEVVFDEPIEGQSNVDAINNTAQFSIGIKEICVLTSAVGDIKYLLKLGSGVYGLGGTQLTDNDLVTVFDISAGAVTSVNGETGDVTVDVKVETVTGDGVNNTDPKNPVLSFPTPSDINAAPLVDGLIPSQYIPGGVDEILEYSSFSTFPATGLEGKIYLALDSNIPYRWGGTVYVAIASSIALGETESTAYRGDRGKLAYDRSTYTNATPMPEDVNGLVAGTTFNATPIPDILDSLLYPFQEPSFTGFSSSYTSLPNTKEIGQTVTPGTGATLNISASNSQNIQNITVKENGVTIFNQVPFATSLSPNSNISFSRSTVGSITMYSLTGLDTNGDAVGSSRTISAKWKARIFYGKSSLTSLDEAGVESLGSELVESTPFNVVKEATGGSGYLYVAIPAGVNLATIGDIYDEGGANNVPHDGGNTIQITNAYGQTITYNLYRSTFSFSGSTYKFQLKA